jgi:AraC-like DNA-binding protein
MRLVRPFVRMLTRDARVPAQALAALPEDPDTRVPVRVVQQFLSAALAITQDQELGLRAAGYIDAGDHDVLEYAASSASTWGEALGVVFRYIRLLSDTSDFSLEITGEQAVMRLDSRLPLLRAALDFQIASVLVAAQYWVAELPRTGQVWFPYPKPASTHMHEQLFGQRVLRFEAPFAAFAFDRTLLDTPLSTADPKLHSVLRRQAEQMLRELPSTEGLSDRVRKLVMELLASGNINSTHVAERLKMSRRTLIRRLEQEGTTYKDILEDARRRMAENHLVTTDLTIHELAFLLGYSETAPFSRAFKRWTSLSPAEYREQRRRA